jgi:CO/xanthine dehydrogenase FAD-binding subunit
MGDYAIVSVAASLELRAGRVERLRLGIGAVGPVPTLLAEIGARQKGCTADPAWIAQVAAAARSAIEPDDSKGIPAAYRRELCETLVARALSAAHERAGALP